STVTAALDELTGLPAEVYASRLGVTMHYPVASMEDLHRWKPAFDLLPFAEALRAQMLLFREDDDQLRLVLADPFATDQIAWADERIVQDFNGVLAHHADVAAYLTRQEDSLSAVEAILPAAMAVTADASGVENLSFLSITEDTSQVVRLVRSTLYDALKTEASDIHLETGPTGRGIKYRS